MNERTINVSYSVTTTEQTADGSMVVRGRSRTRRIEIHERQYDDGKSVRCIDFDPDNSRQRLDDAVNALSAAIRERARLDRTAPPVMVGIPSVCRNSIGT